MIRPALLILAVASSLVAAEPVTRIAFGSCCKQNKPTPIFDSIREFAPQVWIWMGDNIYGDTTDMALMAEKYATLSKSPRYTALRDSCTVIGTWDDHDYGSNDAGKEYPAKAASQQCFLDFLGVPKDDPRREREGIYSSQTFGEGARSVKVILLDTRYHRDEPGPGGDILGPEQWSWLEKELTGSTAAVHLLVSSIQVLPAEHRFEKWSNFPQAQKRLFRLLSRDSVPPVVLLSGDRHLAEVSVEKNALPYPLHEITSSSLNSGSGGSTKEVNVRRLGDNYLPLNFGTLQIDWSTAPATLRFAIRDVDGKAVRKISLRPAR